MNIVPNSRYKSQRKLRTICTNTTEIFVRFGTKFDKIQGHFLLEPLGDCNLSKYRIDQVASIFRWAKGIRYNPRKIDYEHSFGAMPLETRDL